MQTQTVVLLASIYLPSESLRHSQREKKERSLNLRVGRIVVMVERCREESECIEGAEVLKLFFLARR